MRSRAVQAPRGYRRAESTDPDDTGLTTDVSRLDNRAYYDDFAGWYERERHLPYHRMLDDLEVEIVERYGKDRDVLEVGCGTGLILDRVSEFARSARGIDLSGGMLARAAQRGLSVAQASATELPIATG